MPVVQHTAALRGLRPVANAFGVGRVADVEPRHRLVRGGGQLAHDRVDRGACTSVTGWACIARSASLSELKYT